MPKSSVKNGVKVPNPKTPRVKNVSNPKTPGKAIGARGAPQPPSNGKTAGTTSTCGVNAKTQNHQELQNRKKELDLQIRTMADRARELQECVVELEQNMTSTGAMLLTEGERRFFVEKGVNLWKNGVEKDKLKECRDGLEVASAQLLTSEDLQRKLAAEIESVSSEPPVESVASEPLVNSNPHNGGNVSAVPRRNYFRAWGRHKNTFLKRLGRIGKHFFTRFIPACLYLFVYTLKKVKRRLNNNQRKAV